MKKNNFFIAIFFIIVFTTKYSFAEISLSIKNNSDLKTKILFIGFDSIDQSLDYDIKTIFNHISRNLKTTGLFDLSLEKTIINQDNSLQVQSGYVANKNDGLIGKNLESDLIPDFEKYSKSDIGAIVIASFSYATDGNLEVKIRMWDILDQKQLFGKFYTASKDNYKKVANVISNEIFKSITGESVGHFSSQITYVSESGRSEKRIKKINIIDFDGSNHKDLTDGMELVLTPVFSKKGDEIFYLRYFQDKSQIFALNLRTLRSQKVGGFKGTTFAPSVHPKDSNLILLSAISDGNSDIYEMNIANNSAKKLTKNSSIDTSPSYSPDGKNIIFSSDREGSEQIYIMDVEGLSIKRISSLGASYSKPSISPDGKLIAFTRIKSGQFSIGIMNINGKGEKILVDSYLVEGAKWSPNGRYLIYSKKTSPYKKGSIPRLYIVDILTGFESEIPTPESEGATDPDWILSSSYIPNQR